MLDSVSHEKKEDVKAKQLEALKRLGHTGLKLDEYERESISNHGLLQSPSEAPLTLSGTVANEVIHPDDIHVRFSGLHASSSYCKEILIAVLLLQISEG